MRDGVAIVLSKIYGVAGCEACSWLSGNKFSRSRAVEFAIRDDRTSQSYGAVGQY